jgi:Glycosyl hydrolase family 12
VNRISLSGAQIAVLTGVIAFGGCGSSSPSTASGSGGNPSTGTGGTSSTSTGGTTATATGGTTATSTGGTSATGTGGTSSGSCAVGATTGAPGFGSPSQGGQGQSSAKYFGTDVTRDGSTYRFITNWWGTGWGTADVSYNGTSFTVTSATGTSTPDGTPIGYPATYCGQYSENAAHGNCGLPVAYSSIDKLWTGWKWSAPASSGQHNAAWDIWLGTASAFQSYLMVWLRDPPGRQPAGNTVIANVTVANEPGTWNIRYGTVNSKPIVNYVRTEGQDACELEFNVMDFVNDAQARSATTNSLTLPGDTVRAIAVGFELWTGPFSNVASQDFYVKLTTK